MSLLLINHYAGDGKNGMEYRPYLMARRWVGMGESVTIVASSFSHLRSKNPDMGGFWFKEEMVDGIRYVWIRGNKYKGNGVGRIMNMLAFVVGLYVHKSKILPMGCSAVVASSTYPLDIYPARRMARECGAKFVFELHDMWPLSPIELGGMSPGHPYIRLMQKAEDDWCGGADEVVSLLPAAKDHLVEHGLDPVKFHYVPNGIDRGEWESCVDVSEAHRSAIAELKDAGSFIVGYAGGHGLSNALDSLLEAALRVRNPAIRFVLVGDGPEKEELKARAVLLGLDKKMLFLPPVARNQIPALLESFDVAFVAAKRTPLYRFGVSMNKTMDYMMAALPIVSAVDAANDCVFESGCGFSVPSGDPDEIALAIEKLASLGYDELRKIGLRGRDYVLERNDYDVLARNFLEILS